MNMPNLAACHHCILCSREAWPAPSALCISSLGNARAAATEPNCLSSKRLEMGSIFKASCRQALILPQASATVIVGPLRSGELQMSSYAVPVLESPAPVALNEVLLIASGDLRQSANKVCWPAQSEMEKQLTEALRAQGFTLRRAHPYQAALEHGFIYNQRMGMNVFTKI